MALLVKLRKRLGIQPPYTGYRRKLEEAIEAGRIAPYCGLERHFAEVEKLFGWSGEDLVELTLAIEEYGKPVRTVGDLLRMLEEFDSEYEVDR